jgi:hypothetical protein
MASDACVSHLTNAPPINAVAVSSRVVTALRAVLELASRTKPSILPICGPATVAFAIVQVASTLAFCTTVTVALFVLTPLPDVRRHARALAVAVVASAAAVAGRGGVAWEVDGFLPCHMRTPLALASCTPVLVHPCDDTGAGATDFIIPIGIRDPSVCVGDGTPKA